MSRVISYVLYDLHEFDYIAIACVKHVSRLRYTAITAISQSTQSPNYHLPAGGTMKKLFGREKPSVKRPSFEEDPPTRPYALPGSQSSSFSSLPVTSPTPSPFVPRAASPFSTPRDPPRKKPPGGSGAAAAVGILKALDPHPEAEQRSRELSEDPAHHEHPVKEERKDKKPFWERSSGKDKDYDVARDRDRREDDGQAELTRMIGGLVASSLSLDLANDDDQGYLTATASEDWALVLEVCDRASASESNAKEAVKALRREFKCVKPITYLYST